MADEDVRRLEREAAAGDPAVSLRYARALARDGRRAESAAVLHGIAAHEDARAELARFPAWSHAAADAGGSRSLDVEPIVSKPRVLWHQDVRGARYTEQGPVTQLVASPLGVVCSKRQGFVVLDPLTGRTLWRRRSPQRPGPWTPIMEIRGGVLLAANRDLVSRHGVATSDDLGSVDVPLAVHGVIAGGVRFAREGAGQVVAHAVSPGAPAERLWETPLTGTQSGVRIAVAGSSVLVRSDTGLTALDRETGAVRWHSRSVGEPFLADDAGLVSCERDLPQRPDEAALVFRGLDGGLAARVEQTLAPLALGRDFAVATPDLDYLWQPSDSSLVAVERASGAERRLPLHVLCQACPAALARDVVYGTTGPFERVKLAAARVTGELLWQLDLAKALGKGAIGQDDIWTFAALDRMIFVLLKDRTLVALTDLPEH